MAIRVPISGRARRYGYIIWPKKQRDEIRKLVGSSDEVEVVFNEKKLGKRRVDWKYNRISVGPSRTRALSENVSEFIISWSEDGQLEVLCR